MNIPVMIQYVLLRAAVLGMAVCAISAGYAQVGISANGAAPNASAMLDVDVSSLVTKKGMLAPRMTSTERTALPAPANGLIVFQTNDVPPLNPKGFWYYDALAAAWQPLVGGAGGWDLSGNGGTNPATNFLGTTDNQPFVLRTNAVERMRVLANGNTGIGVAAPAEVLDIAGAIRINGAAAATNSAGAIRYNPATGAHDGNIDGTAAGWYQLENLFQERRTQNYQILTGVCAPSYRTIASTSPLPGTGGTGVGNNQTAGTIESPYGQLWEDNRTQFLYTAQDLIDRQLCTGAGGSEITELAFWVKGTANPWYMQNCELKLKNTTATALSTTAGFETGMATVWTGNIPTAGLIANNWNNYVFSSPFTWNGTANLLVEFCFNNPDWSGGSTNIAADGATYAGIMGLYCDACGQATYALCQSLGSPGGCQIQIGDNLVTCDGTLPLWNGSIGTANKRACVRLRAETGTITITTGTGDYMYSTEAVMIGDPVFWAPTGGPIPAPYAFKGPGTLSAESAVWGGTVLLSDHVFDMYYDGAPHPEDTERAKGYTRQGIEEMVNYVERERHLPTIDGRAEWQRDGEFSLDKLNTQLWVTVEEQALYIKELNERTRILEQYLIEKRLSQLR